MIGLQEWGAAGVLLPPMLGYVLIAAALLWPVRRLLQRLRLQHWAWHPALAEIAIFIGLLALVTRLLAPAEWYG